MYKAKLSLIVMIFLFIFSSQIFAKTKNNNKKNIYHKEWIDLNKNGIKDIYEDPNADIEKRISDLISQMTLEEKTVQMVTLYGYKRVLEDDLPTPEWKNKLWKDGMGAIDEHLNGFVQWGKAPSDNQYCWPASKHAWAMNQVQKFFIEDTRLGIPVDFTNEGIRGVENYMATNFPTQLGIGQTWNRDLVHEIGRITGQEARLLGYTNVYAPILDVARDQRWGRMEEVYGESPYLVAELGIQMTRGMQTDMQVASTAKHFAIYSANKGAREGLSRVDPQVSPREVENIHLYPFRRVIQEAGLLGVMSSYNDYNGIPIQASEYYLTTKLRDEYGFKGYVVSDSDAVVYLYNKHKTAGSYKQAVLQSVEAGLNMRCTFRSPDSYVIPLRELVKEGSIAIETIDSRLRDILRVKFLTKLFDSPYVDNIKDADKIVNSKKHQNTALQVSRESIVLLKNKNDILPIDKHNIKSISICGPNANVADYALTHYGPLAVEVTTVLKGVKDLVGSKVDIKYTKGCNLVDDNWPESELMPSELNQTEKQEIQKAVVNAKNSDIAVVVIGGSQRTCGENKTRTSLNLPGHQLALLKAVYNTGTPTVAVIISGRPLSINWTDKYVPGIIQAFYPGSQGGKAIAEVLFGDYNPGGKLTVTFPKTVGQIPFNFPAKPNSQIDSWGQSGVNGSRTRVNGCLYPFGYGLSYTNFKYSDIKFDKNNITNKQKLIVSANITNIGKTDGDEVVQLYIRDLLSSVTTYEKNLRGFQRVHLKVNETKRVRFQISPDDLALLDANMKSVVEPGDFKIMIASSSEDVKLSKILRVIDINQLKSIKDKEKSNYVHSLFSKEDLVKLFDKNNYNYWSADESFASIDFELNDKAKPSSISILWNKKTNCNFEILLSGGGGQFISVYKGNSNKANGKLHTYSFKGFPASDLRLVMKTNKTEKFIGINEIILPLLKQKN